MTQELEQLTLSTPLDIVRERLEEIDSLEKELNAQLEKLKEIREETEKQVTEHPTLKPMIESPGTLKVSGLEIITEIEREWCPATLKEIRNAVPALLWPFKYHAEERPDLSEYLQLNEPETWKLISTALTIKPQKPRVKVELLL